MSDKVLALESVMTNDDIGAAITNLWLKFDGQRSGRVVDWMELQDYIFATDTRTTSNKSNPHENNVTLPKLTQIRDNLHSNYKSHLFPNDDWLKWEAYTSEAAQREKARNIETYMANKTRESHMEATYSKLLYDYIDYGNAFVMPAFESRYNIYQGQKIADYIGPLAVRINPNDIVFDPTASAFDKTFKVIRSLRSIGELIKLAQTEPEQAFWEDAVEHRKDLRKLVGSMNASDNAKFARYANDGFGSFYEYVGSDFVEVLDFYGDFYDSDKMTLTTNTHITVVDRSRVVRQEKINTYSGRAPIRHVGWRTRQDNLWAMGPLDNLVGLQYHIDKIRNGAADALDAIQHPMFMNIGDVEEWQIGPDAQINIDEDGEVRELQRDLNPLILAGTTVQETMDMMELFAGAPREAMGVRSPGEKTLGEVQILDNAASRIFQEKITTFEKELLEPNLNDQLEISTRNLDANSVISALDKDTGAQEFLTITKEDITASGVLRAVGARHFAKTAQDLQNMTAIMGSAIGATIAPHVSSVNLALWVESITGVKAYDIFETNVSIMEQKETQDLVTQAQEEIDVANQVDPESIIQDGEEESIPVQ